MAQADETPETLYVMRASLSVVDWFTEIAL